jgi:hypothetical protein
MRSDDQPDPNSACTPGYARSLLLAICAIEMQRMAQGIIAFVWITVQV